MAKLNSNRISNTNYNDESSRSLRMIYYKCFAISIATYETLVTPNVPAEISIVKIVNKIHNIVNQVEVRKSPIIRTRKWLKSAKFIEVDTILHLIREHFG